MLRSGKHISARAALYSKMAPPLLNSSNSFDAKKPVTYSTTALKRWSCLNNNKDLPAIPDVKAIHVYDFDNTLFNSPLPNPQLWNGLTIGFLQAYESFANGGWWHDPNILAATGQGIDVEEPLAWKGWWNEQIVELVELSMKQKDVLTVLLTGRAESSFAEIIKRIVKSRSLEFDLVCLKPEIGPNSQRFSSTINFKQIFLEDMIFTYKHADEIRVYEDRIRHVKGFRDYFEQFNLQFLAPNSHPIRKSITAEVIHVAESTRYLPPVAEAAEVQRMINSHNAIVTAASGNVTKSPYGRLRIHRVIFYTGYMLANADSERLVKYLTLPMLSPSLVDSGDVKLMANTILITPRAAPKAILDRVGGIGKVVRWRVTDTAVFENKIWAARVAPISDSEDIYTDNPDPVVVLALRRGARPIDVGRIRNWNPVSEENALVFDTTIGEKLVLRVAEDNSDDGDGEAPNVGRPFKRRHKYDTRDNEDVPSYPKENHREPGRPRGGYNDYSRSRHERHPDDRPQRHYHDEDSRRGPPPPGYRGGGRGRAGRGGRGGRGRGRAPGPREGGGYAGYRSLDDYPSSRPGYDGAGDDRGGPGSGNPVMNY
ncbi:hypothetical protein D8B26_000129 [Coccidioides posadasii str. Silveira]|nr:hypothetical protein D8B26_000129 [Coccidioides posadasii str. Silveira]